MIEWQKLVAGLLALVTSYGIPGGAGTPAQDSVQSTQTQSAPASGAAQSWGNPNGKADVPQAGRQVVISGKTKVVGTGSPASCTPKALQRKVRSGGIVTFNCGAEPITITLKKTLHVCNTTTCKHQWEGGKPVRRLVIDGGNKVTISGGDAVGILYANVCDEKLGWRSAQCQNEGTPRIVLQNLALVNGKQLSAAPTGFEGVGNQGGGGAIAIRGAALTTNNVLLKSNRCMKSSSDGGGGAIRLVGSNQTSYVVNTTIQGNKCANGGAISLLQSPTKVLNSVLKGNKATGHGANTGQGGNGGGIYSDGLSQSLTVDGSVISGNKGSEGGTGVFYVSNDKSGTLSIIDSKITDNTGERFWTNPYRDLFVIARDLKVRRSQVD